MAVYSIKEISILSGIKAHTIRIWEKRYKMFTPERTDTNIRRYSDSDLKLALNASLLINMGYKISRIANMAEEEISSIVSKGNKYTSPPPVPEALFISAINFDKESFLNKITESVDQRGLEWTFENLVVPFQKRIGLLWLTGTITPAQEHFASNILREFLIKSSLDLTPNSQKKEKILFFLPEGEMHELGLLYFNSIANIEGYQTIYLGQNVPIEDVTELALKHNVKYLFTSITMSLPKTELMNFLNAILTSIPEVKLLVTGNLFEQSEDSLPSKIVKISSAEQFRNAIKKS
jgi:methanogenic corrinoid protein MtbC1